VLSLAYFKAPGLPGTLQEIPLEYFKRASDWLLAQPGVEPGALAVIGASKGSEAALLIASRDPRVRAVAAFSPSSVVWQGIPAQRFALGRDVRSSWSEDGQGLPFLAYQGPFSKLDLLTLRLAGLHERSLADAGAAAAAAIPVERIKGSVLLLSARNDRLWPAVDMGEEIMRRLEASDFPHPHKHVIFGGGHGTLVMNRDAWRAIFASLEASLQPAGR
jgi:alpha-beta hydrolase superfamily lysophospholipase